LAGGEGAVCCGKEKLFCKGEEFGMDNPVLFCKLKFKGGEGGLGGGGGGASCFVLKFGRGSPFLGTKEVLLVPPNPLNDLVLLP
jgi:hypothetical protein